MAPALSAAINDFHRARRKANLERVMARLRGKSADLLSYEEVRRQLRASKQIARGLQDIPLDAIVGSVGRYKDFTRTFLPTNPTDEQRWANLLVVNATGTGLPPIELYKIGEAYFVLDGNHRVSIAREQGFPTVQAYVTEVVTKVPITADIDADELIIKAEYTQFLERTKLDELRPEADLTVTVPNKYTLIEEHIAVHNYFMGLDFQREIDWDEAVVHWYDEVYLPVIHMIRVRGLMRDFPQRTETDLYVWLAENREALETELGWRLETEEAVEALLTRQKTSPLEKQREQWLEMLVPDELEAGPPVGLWRQKRLQTKGTERLFSTLLVSVGEDELSWPALDTAVAIAQREEGQIRGLHIINEYTEQTEMLAAFDKHVKDKGVLGELAFDMGDLYRKVCDRSRWSDLVVLSLTNPPGEQMLDRLASGWRTVLHRSPRPVLAVPVYSPLNHALLVCDGTPKAQEALYIATYMAGRWHIPLTVLTMGKEEQRAMILGEAKGYLEAHGIHHANYVQKGDDPAINILLTAEKHGCDFIVMGGYNTLPVIDLLMGSTVDQVLRNASCPILVCR